MHREPRKHQPPVLADPPSGCERNGARICFPSTVERRMTLPPCGRAVLVAAFLALTVSAPVPLTAQQASLNTLTPAEREAGWALLFDGTSTAGWRGFRMTTMPAGWEAKDGALTRVSEAADIITVREYANFELTLEWSISPKGNSGIMYRVTEADSNTYETGPEYQVLDDQGHRDGLSRLTAAGSVYGLYPAPDGLVRPVGEWNQARIIVNGNDVEHWLNGTLVAHYVLGSPDWEARVANSKFRQWPGYGRAKSGYIALQEHGGWVGYRNIKIRVLP